MDATTSNSVKRKQAQSSLISFFGQPAQKKTKEDSEKDGKAVAPSKPSAVVALATQKQENDDTKQPADPLAPIVPNSTAPLRPTDRWGQYRGAVLYRTVKKEPPRSKVAAFDMDGTLLAWRTAGWPSRPEHYEVFNATVIDKLRHCYDVEGCKLLVVSNQGAIRSAVGGKKALHVQSLVNWLAHRVDRPLFAVMSCDKKRGYHKPSADLWDVAVEVCNESQEFDIANSFFVGDSIGTDDDPQGGVDIQFAQNVSKRKGTTLKFYSPEEYFGPSSKELRQKQVTLEPPPQTALDARAGLCCGYYNLSKPIMVILCGVQGSGKSTFAEALVKDSDQWTHLSQDTINNGKPGKREKVEAMAKKGLEQGKCVIVDRMHIDKMQREYFVNIAKEMNVPVHAIVLRPAKNIVAQRVRERQNHPGNVQGEKGATMAVLNVKKMVMPTYKEGFTLISAAGTSDGASRLLSQYRQLTANPAGGVPESFSLSKTACMPSLVLGTMNMGRKTVSDTVSGALEAGFEAFDTAPTYKNEDKIGQVLSKHQFCIMKVPKRAVKAEEVRSELKESLAKLQREHADLLLLHWPSDVIASGTLQVVWKEMEKCVEDGLAHSLGVCNFNASSLALLLPHCSIPPAVNQVERHPLLPQWDLVDFCAQHDILLQAHTPLCQGSDELLMHPVVRKVATETNQSAAQVVLGWNLQQNVSVVPKCSGEEHMEEILSIYTTDGLKPTHLEMLNNIEERKRFVAPFFMYGNAPYCWDKKAPSTS